MSMPSFYGPLPTHASKVLTQLPIAIICFFNGIYYFVMSSIDRKIILDLIGGVFYILIGMTFFVALTILYLTDHSIFFLNHFEHVALGIMSTALGLLHLLTYIGVLESTVGPGVQAVHPCLLMIMAAMLYEADYSWISNYAVKMEHTAAISLFCTGASSVFCLQRSLREVNNKFARFTTCTFSLATATFLVQICIELFIDPLTITQVQMAEKSQAVVALYALHWVCSAVWVAVGLVLFTKSSHLRRLHSKLSRSGYRLHSYHRVTTAGEISDCSQESDANANVV